MGLFGKKEIIYLDNGATTPVDPKVVEAMLPFYTEKFGNASSLHQKGQEAKRALDEAREVIAKSVGAKFDEIYFTGSGTEANNWVVKSLALANPNSHIITTKIEHDCILNSCKWLESKKLARVTYLDVDKEGFVNLEQLKKSLTRETILVSIIHGNNEIGTIQNLKEIAKICHEKGALLHTDACQSYMKTELDVKKMNLDLVTLNAHKIHGPKGVGALYIRSGIKIEPFIHGGGQEMKMRSGTENVAGIVGFATAVKLLKSSDITHIEKLRDKAIKTIIEKIPNVKLNGAWGNNRLVGNINLCFHNIEGEAIGSFLDTKGICISTGSACSSKSLDPSHVLMALGMSAQDANSSVRISLGKFTTEEEIDKLLEELPKVVSMLRKMSPLK